MSGRVRVLRPRRVPDVLPWGTGPSPPLGLHGRQHRAIARWLGPVAVLACAGFGALGAL